MCLEKWYNTDKLNTAASAFEFSMQMAQKTQRVASALNRLVDGAFVDALSVRDQSSMADLVADFFMGDPDTDTDVDSEEEDEPGK